MALTDIRDGTSTTIAVGERGDFFAQSPWAGVIGGGTTRTTLGAPVYSSEAEPAPSMVLARVGFKPLNSPLSEPYDFFSPHPQIVNFLFADGSVHAIKTSIDIALMQALATASGHEPVDSSSFYVIPSRQFRCTTRAMPIHRAAEGSNLLRSPMKAQFGMSQAPLAVVGGVFLLFLDAGCSRTPSAPALRDDPVYHSANEGFRFLVPEGWVQRANAELPPGRLEKERLLVKYIYLSPDSRAQLQTSVADLPKATDLVAQAAAPSFAVSNWSLVGQPEPVETEGRSGTRYVFTGRMGKEDMTKEVTVFRRGERVYFFTGLFASGDSKARGQVQRAIATVIWKW
jgi:prepilin-type processing-associated H-X9-DG protein